MALPVLTPMLYKENFGEESFRQNSQNSELLHRPKGKTRKHEKGEKLDVNRMRLFLKQIYADIPCLSLRRSEIHRVTMANQARVADQQSLQSQSIGTMHPKSGGQVPHNDQSVCVENSFRQKNTHHQFVCAFPEVWEQVRNIAVRLTLMERATAKGLSTTRALLPPEAV